MVSPSKRIAPSRIVRFTVSSLPPSSIAGQASSCERVHCFERLPARMSSATPSAACGTSSSVTCPPRAEKLSSVEPHSRLLAARSTVQLLRAVHEVSIAEASTEASSTVYFTTRRCMAWRKWSATGSSLPTFTPRAEAISRSPDASCRTVKSKRPPSSVRVG